MSIVRRKCKIDESIFECYICITFRPDGSEMFWFKEEDIIAYLKQRKTKNTIDDGIRFEWQTTWEKLKSEISTADFDEVLSWPPETVFISEVDLYILLSQFKKPQATKLTSWIHKEILPSLRS